MKKFLIKVSPILLFTSLVTPAFALINPLPNGTYQNSCRVCHISGPFMVCNCQTEQGAWIGTKIDLSNGCQSVVNVNGRLQCQSSYSYLPRGDYKNSCSNCRMKGNYLSCYCRNNYGAVVPAGTYVYRNCHSVRNFNGRLVCYQKPHRKHTLWMNAGPIWNDADAQVKCPNTCGRGNDMWTGQWKTVQLNVKSICECRF